MQLMAMIEGLKLVKPDEAVTIYIDSQLGVCTLAKWAAGWEVRGRR